MVCRLILGIYFCQSWILVPLIFVKITDSVVIMETEHLPVHAIVPKRASIVSFYKACSLNA